MVSEVSKFGNLSVNNKREMLPRAQSAKLCTIQPGNLLYRHPMIVIAMTTATSRYVAAIHQPNSSTYMMLPAEMFETSGRNTKHAACHIKLSTKISSDSYPRSRRGVHLGLFVCASNPKNYCSQGWKISTFFFKKSNLINRIFFAKSDLFPLNQFI